MELPIVNLESDVVENIFRPISLFLNEVPSDTKLDFLSVYETAGKLDPTKPVYHYKFLASNGNIYSFTQYDLSHFSTKGVDLTKSLKVRATQSAQLRTSFTILSTKERKTVGGDIMYPPFAYSGYESYLEQLDEDADVPKLRKQLFNTKVKEDYKDRFYRVVDIDQDIVYYKD